MDLAARIAAQRAYIVHLEAALWRDGLDESGLAPYQQAFRELEQLLADQGLEQRHHFVVVIPVADSPQHLRSCLDSLLAQCRAYGYGGMHNGRYAKISVLLADDSTEPACMEHNRAIAAEFDDAGITVHYFGQEEQLALLERLHAVDLHGVVGEHPQAAFGHKGQAMMRNIAYLRLTELQREMTGEPLLFYTIDADQQFRVKVATADGGRRVDALNYFYFLDRLFRETDAQILTGKVVGDPPVSPAVMAKRFLDDAGVFLAEMSVCDAHAAYRQPSVDTRGSAEAAYHDMADMFGFGAQPEPYRFRCSLPGTPSNADCVLDFAQRLNGFFHGEHPTRITWYRHQPVLHSVQPARTIYTGNYVFTARALDWFIPFAPLRLRMSGPTMGRILRSALGDAFVSANVPMLHARTLAATGASEYRPGVIATSHGVDLSDEFERQFFGDVMLFAIERLTAQGYPMQMPSDDQVGEVLDALHDEMLARYLARQQTVLQGAERLRALLQDAGQWWNRMPGMAEAVGAFTAFLRNIERNFGADSGSFRRILAGDAWPGWRARQLAAILGLPDDRAVWQRALDILRLRAAE